MVTHTGQGLHPRPQGVSVDPANRFAFVCDVGLDRVAVYRFDPEKGKLTLNDPPLVATKPGAGPRRTVFRATDALHMC